MNYSLSRTAIVIGDVSGKGAPAAIYAALVSGILRSHAPIEPSASEMLSAVNLSLGERRIDGQFVSLIYAVWDDENRTCRLRTQGFLALSTVTAIRSKSSKQRDYRWACSMMQNTKNSASGPSRDDLFVFFSDGILDATNRAGELLDEGKVEKIVRCSANSAQDIVDAILRCGRGACCRSRNLR